MEITSKPFGKVTVADDSIITVPEGLYGFEEFKRYVMLSNPDERPFSWLQAVDNPRLAMVVVNPGEVFGARFAPKPAAADLLALEVQSPANLVFCCIVVVPEDPKLMTVNLKGPVALNMATRRARQIILLNEEYTVRHLLLKEMEAARLAAGQEAR
ncbi:MAG TPA: flagellar assembly protein FliW [bacterium]|nr:flagellar assembly protein FliW [bacterium]